MRFLAWTLPIGVVVALAGTLAGGALTGAESPAPGVADVARAGERERERRTMVQDQLQLRDIRDPRVLAAMTEVPRHLFVPQRSRRQAYGDHPLPIGYGQTISQPYVVALMTQLLEPRPDHRVLEIGTGSGYAAAVLSRVVGEVYTIEIVEPLAQRAAALLRDLDYGNIHVRAGDGYRGWPEEAPFDAIVLTAAPEVIPAPLIDQLAVGGRMVLPVGAGGHQELKVLTRTEDGVETRSVIPVRFVPMTGEAQELRPG